MGLRGIATAGLIALATAAAGTLLWQRAELARSAALIVTLSRDLADTTAILAQAQAAAAVHRAHIERLAAEATAWAQLTRDLQSMEGRDAPLSDHLRAAAGKLWP